jgi:hypothetical protein
VSVDGIPGSKWVGRGCPHCEFVVWEPPIGFTTETTDEGWRLKVTSRSVLPALAVHVVTEHPDTEAGRELLRRAEEHWARRNI